MSLDGGERLPYDHLVIATGSTTNYFGNESVAAHALGLKDLSEAVTLRNHVLETSSMPRTPTVTSGPRCSRSASSARADRRRIRGRLAELVRLVLPLEYPELHVAHVRIELIEMGERVLASFHPSLGRGTQHVSSRISVWRWCSACRSSRSTATA